MLSSEIIAPTLLDVRHFGGNGWLYKAGAALHSLPSEATQLSDGRTRIHRPFWQRIFLNYKLVSDHIGSLFSLFRRIFYCAHRSVETGDSRRGAAQLGLLLVS